MSEALPVHLILPGPSRWVAPPPLLPPYLFPCRLSPKDEVLDSPLSAREPNGFPSRQDYQPGFQRSAAQGRRVTVLGYASSTYQRCVVSTRFGRAFRNVPGRLSHGYPSNWAHGGKRNASQASGNYPNGPPSILIQGLFARLVFLLRVFPPLRFLIVSIFNWGWFDGKKRPKTRH